MWWTGNSCCFIGFCGTFLVLSGPSGDLVGPPRGAIIILPWRTNQKVEGSSVAFILWFRSGTYNVRSLSAQDAQGWCLVKEKIAPEEVKMKISWSCSCVHIDTLMCIYMYAGGCFSVCEHLPVYTVASPDGNFPWGEKPTVQSSSSDFTLMMLFVWWSLRGVRKLRRSCSARIKEPQWKIDKGGCLKDEQDLRSETQRGSQRLGVHQWRLKKQNVSVRGARGWKGRLMNECEGPKKEE